MSNAQIAAAKDQLDLLAFIDSVPQRAFGVTYDPNRDSARLSEQGLQVFRCLSDGQWWTLPKIGAVVDGLSSSHSARIRQIRKWLIETGRGTIEDLPPVNRGLWSYRIVRTWPIAGQHYRKAEP